MKVYRGNWIIAPLILVSGQYQAKVDLSPIKNPSTYSALRKYCNTLHTRNRHTVTDRLIKCVNVSIVMCLVAQSNKRSGKKYATSTVMTQRYNTVDSDDATSQHSRQWWRNVTTQSTVMTQRYNTVDSDDATLQHSRQWWRNVTTQSTVITQRYNTVDSDDATLQHSRQWWRNVTTQSTVFQTQGHNCLLTQIYARFSQLCCWKFYVSGIWHRVDW
jgi:hypothetical protein